MAVRPPFRASRIFATRVTFTPAPTTRFGSHMTADVEDNIAKLRQRIAASEEKSGRHPGSVRLLAVGKTRTGAELRRAVAAGITAIGENYLQEAVQKIHALSDLAIEWHFIGPLQSNKTRPVAELFQWVHSVDRPRLAERLNAQRPDHLPPLNVCLQVNISAEPSKAGCTPAELPALAAAVAGWPRLRLRGLMAIPAPAVAPSRQRADLEAMHQLFLQLQQDYPELDTLSLGMSADLEQAIAAGSTLVRIGTDIFGPRT